MKLLTHIAAVMLLAGWSAVSFAQTSAPVQGTMELTVLV